MKTYTITMTADVAQKILNVLAEQPYKEVVEAINVVHNQILIQNKEPEPQNKE